MMVDLIKTRRGPQKTANPNGHCHPGYADRWTSPADVRPFGRGTPHADTPAAGVYEVTCSPSALRCGRVGVAWSEPGLPTMPSAVVRSLGLDPQSVGVHRPAPVSLDSNHVTGRELPKFTQSVLADHDGSNPTERGRYCALVLPGPKKKIVDVATGAQDGRAEHARGLG